MISDLKLIKHKYGEDMMHLCRRLFPTILEYEGLLFKVLSNNFDYSKCLYDDIVNNEMVNEFKNFIISQAKVEIKIEKNDVYKSPQELMSEAGYDLFECKNDKEIEAFTKYYADGERLCTFGDDRLNDNYVFFAVRRDADKVSRSDNPAREDSYGTSVISIQFTRGEVNTLSIMNRYNDTVRNPDATFSNNLDNIIPGLTSSFEKKYGFNIYSNKRGFDMPNYVKAKDGKFYKYNFEKNGIFYCPNNIIIDSRFNPIKFDKEKYIIVDDYIIDLVNKEVKLFDKNIKDSFIDGFSNISNIKVLNDKDNHMKKIIINNDIILDINKDNRLISYYNPNLLTLDNSFINYRDDSSIEKLDLPGVLQVQEDFFEGNKNLKEIRLNNCKKIENGFLRKNKELRLLYAPNVLYVGDSCLSYNNCLSSIDLPNVVEIGNDFLAHNRDLKSINCNNLKIIGSRFMVDNNTVKTINLPNVIDIKENFMLYNNSVVRVSLPKVKNIGHSFLYSNEVLNDLYLPEVIDIGYRFLRYNNSLSEINLPCVKRIDYSFLQYNNRIKSISFPELLHIGNNFLSSDMELESVYLPKVITIGNGFIHNAFELKTLFVPNIDKESYLKLDDSIKLIYASKNNNKKIKKIIFKKD